MPEDETFPNLYDLEGKFSVLMLFLVVLGIVFVLTSLKH